MRLPASSNETSLKRVIPWILLIGGLVGLVCSFIIMFEKIQLLQNPHYTPSCNLNPVISCGSVMASKQANAFGFPNPLIGLVAFPVLITIGTIFLTGGKIPRWIWWGILSGTLFGVSFIHWLFFESVYRIHALCPYCMVVWITTITLFVYTLIYNLELDQHKANTFWQSSARFLRRHHLDITLFWILVIAALIIKHFWYYFGSFLK